MFLILFQAVLHFQPKPVWLCFHHLAQQFQHLPVDQQFLRHENSPVLIFSAENGVIGVGRTMSLQEIRQGSQIIVDSYKKTNPNHPMIPVDFAGLVLVEINPDHNRVNARYSDFGGLYYQDVSFEVRNVSSEDQQYFLNFAKPNSEFWQIGDTIIRIGGSAFDKNSERPERFRNYNIEFILDGFMFDISGPNLDVLKSSIVANYFPEYEYDDLFLVSSTVEK